MKGEVRVLTCKNCKASWTYPAGFVKVTDKCPFCGKSLMPEHGIESSLSNVLSYIADTFGDDAMKDGRKLLSLFADLAPNLKREKILLRHFVECDGNSILLKAFSADEPEARIKIRMVIDRMEQELLVLPDAAQNICLVFWTAIGGSGDVLNNDTVLAVPEKSAAVAVAQFDIKGQASIQQRPDSQRRDEDLSWKRSEAAHRAWLKSQSEDSKQIGSSKATAAKVPKLPMDPDEAWKRSEAAHRAWLNSLQKQ